MKKTKFSRFFESLIYFILLTIPLISVFARVIYVQSNENAKDSYSDTSVTSIRNVDLSVGTTAGITYYISYRDTGVGTNTGTKIRYSNLSINWSDYGANPNLDYDRFYISLAQSGTYIYLYNSDSSPIETLFNVWGYTLTSFSFTSDATQSLSATAPIYLNVIIIEVNNLDNAFDYGIQKTIDDFGVGNIDFLNWFGTMFSNNNNLLYINFVNMYLNYALWVSVGYLLYYFLNWFIRFVREILDNLIYKETKN